MANLPLESVIINPLERPTSKDINQLQMQAHQDMRLLARELFYGQISTNSDGFVGAGFKPEVLSAAGRTLSLRNGLMFQYRVDAEDNIDGIQGLTDAYFYKAAFNLDGITIAIDPEPIAAGNSRIDLIQMRVPLNLERLKEPTELGIFNPALKTFSSEDKPKLLSSTLTATNVQTIPAGSGDPATQPIIYKVGTEGASPVAPAEEAGYLTIATVTSTNGQPDLLAGDIEDLRNLLYLNPSVGGTGLASLPAGEILLGNGTDAIDSVAVLPMSKGGTGRAPITFLDTLGSVAYLDTTGADSLKYTQAASVGSLLASNTVGAPTWIEPGADGQVLVSTGTAWEAEDWTRYYSTLNTTYTASVTSASYTPIAQLSLSSIALRKGNVRIELSPNNAADAAGIFWAVGTPATLVANILFEVTLPDATVWSYVFRYQAVNNQDYPVTLPSVTLLLSQAGNCDVAVSAITSATASTLTFRNCDLVVSQG